MAKICIGVAPGIDGMNYSPSSSMEVGAIAAIDENLNVLYLKDVPVRNVREMVDTLKRLLLFGENPTIILGTPNWKGADEAYHYGLWHGIIVALGLPVERVDACTWRDAVMEDSLHQWRRGEDVKRLCDLFWSPSEAEWEYTHLCAGHADALGLAYTGLHRQMAREKAGFAPELERARARAREWMQERGWWVPEQESATPEVKTTGGR